MPRYSEDFLKSAEDVAKYLSKILGVVDGFKFLREVERSLPIRSGGTVPYPGHRIEVFVRRKAVMSIFNGSNYKEVSEQLGVTMKTVKNDVAWCYKNRVSKNRSKKQIEDEMVFETIYGIVGKYLAKANARKTKKPPIKRI
jgi:hypothetical protein